METRKLNLCFTLTEGSLDAAPSDSCFAIVNVARRLTFPDEFLAEQREHAVYDWT